LNFPGGARWGTQRRQRTPFFLLSKIVHLFIEIDISPAVKETRAL